VFISQDIKYTNPPAAHKPILFAKKERSKDISKHENMEKHFKHNPFTKNKKLEKKRRKRLDKIRKKEKLILYFSNIFYRIRFNFSSGSLGGKKGKLTKRTKRAYRME
jgi:hypothetical protein